VNGLIGAVGSTRVRYVAEGEFLFAAAEVLDLQLPAGDFAFLLVEFPLAAKRIVRGAERSREQADERE